MLRKLYPVIFFLNIVLFLININHTLVMLMCLVNIFFLVSFLSKCKKNDLTYLKWLGCFALFCLLSCLWALNSRVALWVIIQQQIPIYTLCVSMFVYVKDWKDLYKCLRGYYFASIILLIYVILNVDLMTLAGSRLTDANDEQLWNPNYLGLYLALGIYAGFFSVFKEKDKYFLDVLVYLIAIIGMIAVIFLSGSRAALISLVSPLIVKVFISNKNILKSTLIISVILVICYSLIMYVPVLYLNIGIRIEELFNILSGEGVGDDSRMVLISSGLKWFQDAPILGIGINNFRILSGARLHYVTAFYAHNNYVELLVDIGIIGFAVYYISYIFLLSRFKVLDKEKKSWALGFLVMLLFSDMFHVSYYEVSMQILLCILYIIIRIERLNYINYRKSTYEKN